MDVDVTQALKDAENSLRDFIAIVLESKFGVDWSENCGVTAERVRKWQERKKAEIARQATGAVEPRLLYYADFYDLRPILKKHWGLFSNALGDLKTMDVYLNEMERLRDPEAHRRELLPHQKYLAAGIAGEIRTRLIRYRSKLETPDDYFPRIECARDSQGNVWTPKPGVDLKALVTKTILRAGDKVEFVVTAADPLGGQLTYRLSVGEAAQPWQTENNLQASILKKHIAKSLNVRLEIVSARDDHAYHRCDDWVEFLYSVLPESR